MLTVKDLFIIILYLFSVMEVNVRVFERRVYLSIDFETYEIFGK